MRSSPPLWIREFIRKYALKFSDPNSFAWPLFELGWRCTQPEQEFLVSVIPHSWSKGERPKKLVDKSFSEHVHLS